MEGKKRVLIFVDWFLPGYKAGGPIRSCNNLIEHLYKELQFSVLTRNTDYQSTKPYETIKSDNWTVLENGTKVYYFSGKRLGFTSFNPILKSKSFEIIYLNSLFSFWFTLVPLFWIRLLKIKAKVILAPRGMLAQGALSKKPLKKTIFIYVAKLTGLFNHVTWHASSEFEEQDIINSFGNKATIIIAPNLPSKIPDMICQRPKNTGSIKLIYLSRIAVEKNLLSAIEYLTKINKNANVVFDIIGPVDDQHYWEICQAAIGKLPNNILSEYKGEVPYNMVERVFSEYHFLLLPTLGENFGHVILEAMSAGCPVIISDQTPWRNLENTKAGWDISLADPDRFVKIIEYCIEMKQDEFDIWSKAAYEYARSHFNDKKKIDQNRTLFLT